MVCDRCGPSREQGFSFCPECGAPLKDKCEYCDRYAREGYEFCGKCGRPLQPSTTVATPSPMKIAPMTAMPFIIILLVAEIIMLLANSGDVFSYLKDFPYNVNIFMPVRAVLGVLTGTSLQAYWIIVVLTILASAALVIYQSVPMFKPRKDGDTSQAEKTPLYWLCLLFTGLYALETAIGLIIILFSGTDITPPDWITQMDPEELLFSLANAGFWEEIVFRALPIGIPVAILALCHGRKGFLANILGGFGMTRLGVFLIIATALIFAYAHVDGWGLAKMVPAFLGGLVLGYLYVRFGLHASILFHFVTDYMFTIAVGSLGTMLLGGLLLIILVVGIPCLAIILKKLRAGLHGIRSLPATGFEDDP